MAKARVSGNLEGFICRICSDLLKDPVTVPCGHSFCMTCINTQWDAKFHRGVSPIRSCPVCKHHFGGRLILERNIILAEMVEKLKKTRASEGTLAGPDDVECDLCSGEKHKAVKSCLDCLASYCKIHFNLHNELNPGITHKVTETRYNLRVRICSRHNKLQDVICFTEDRAVCSECATSYCRGHNTITFAKRRAQQQLEIQKIRSEVLERTEVTLNSMTDLKETIESIKSSAKTTLDQSEKILVELIRSAERKRFEIRELIKATENAEVQRAEELLKHMEQEVTKLKNRDGELVQLPQIDDDLLFLKTYISLSDFSTFDDVTHLTGNMAPLEEIQNSVSELATKVQEFYMTGSQKSGSGNSSHMVLTPIPVIREDFLEYFGQLTVDPSTANDSTKPNDDRGPEIFNYYTKA